MAYITDDWKSITGGVNLTPPVKDAGPCCSVNAPCDEEYLYGVYDNYIQAWYPHYATDDMDNPKPILCPRRDAQLIIKPNQTHIGLYDGFSNDNFRSFSTTLRTTEIWSYLNADTGDSHPLHFHLTSGFAYKNLLQNTSGPGSETTAGLTHTYSRDIYQIGPQQTISFVVTWPYYSSDYTTTSPNIKNIGAVIHCHFLPHNDLNSMMLSYAVKPGIIDEYKSACYNEGSMVLILENNIEIYKEISTLKSGDLVKTYTNGYKRIDLIGKKQLINNPLIWCGCMYIMKKSIHTELLKDLIVVGGHSILVDKL